MKTAGKPILIVKDPQSNTKIHLVGVSHGSAPSAALVRETMEHVKPAAVVVELCDDRFMTISLDAAIEPRGKRTVISEYRTKVQLITQP